MRTAHSFAPSKAARNAEADTRRYRSERVNKEIRKAGDYFPTARSKV
jgi:hypothetical protein